MIDCYCMGGSTQGKTLIVQTRPSKLQIPHAFNRIRVPRDPEAQNVHAYGLTFMVSGLRLAL